ncbi:hypothetical protein FRC00_003772 [Tulasnella sp. 408]|nr:hypothetical protein FRC00_003772 [Tulasnella sp. 408]
MVQAGTYRLRNVKSGTYLDESDKNQDTVHGWDSRPQNDNQKWILEPAGDESFRIKNLEHGRYVAVSGPKDGAPVKASSGDRDVWTFKNQGRGYAIYLQGTGHVIDLDQGKDENGTRVSVWGYTGAHQQLWDLEQVEGGRGGSYGQQQQQQQPSGQQQDQWSNYRGDGQQQYQGAIQPGTYRVHNVFTNTALDLAGGKSDDNTPVIAWSQGSGANQTWSFESGSRGYRIKNGASGSFLGYDGFSEGSLLAGRSQPVEWTVTQADQGYQIHPADNPGWVLDLAEGKKDDGAKICLWSNKNGDNQKWRLERA